MKLQPIGEWSLKAKIVSLLVLIVIIYSGWYTLDYYSDSRVTRALKNMPQGTVQVINDEGRTVNVRVRIADNAESRRAGFKGAGATTVADRPIYYIYPRDTNERHNVQGVRVPLEIGFFSADGTLLHVARTQVNATASYGVTGTTRYRYAIMANEGFFARHSMSLDGESKLLPDSLRR